MPSKTRKISQEKEWDGTFPPLKPEFIKSIESHLGEKESLNLISSLDTPAETSIRLNSRKKIQGQIYSDMEPVGWCEKGFYLPERPTFTLNPLFHSGSFYVQDAASMIHRTIINSISEGNKLRVLDLCAAPGGKTTAIIDALPDGSLVVANEYDQKRAQILKENISKWGYPDVIVTNGDARRFGKLKECFDILVVDAPCSGEGMMRKEATARTQWSEGLVSSCAALQREILKNSLPALRRGGYLIYSTCTFNRKENEDNVRWLTEEFGLENVPLELPGTSGCGKALDPDINALRFHPGRTRGEGLFVAILRRKDDGPDIGASFSSATGVAGKTRYSRMRKEEQGKSRSSRSIVIPEWIKNREGLRINFDGETFSTISSSYSQFPDHLRQAGVRILSAGVSIARMAGKDPAPAQELAWSTLLDEEAFPKVELTENEALAYLTGDSLVFPVVEPKGYILVTFRGMPLGFVKNLGSRANNLYPKQWRIRMQTPAK